MKGHVRGAPTGGPPKLVCRRGLSDSIATGIGLPYNATEGLQYLFRV